MFPLQVPDLSDLPYGCECGPEKTEALRSRVIAVKPQVIYFKELHVHSIHQLDVMFGRVHELSNSLSEWCLILDLREASQPNAQIRDHIRQKVLSLKKPKLIAIVIGANEIIQVGARFVLARSIDAPHCFVKTTEEAFEKSCEVLQSK